MSPVFRHGRLRLYLLKLLDESPRHGYEVIRLLQDRFMGVYAPSPGTIYPRLTRLEEEGLVTHDEADGRKVYRITEKGREELRNRPDDLSELEDEITASVRDIAREVTEDVRETVRNLREELTFAARDMQRRGAPPRDAAQPGGATPPRRSSGPPRRNGASPPGSTAPGAGGDPRATSAWDEAVHEEPPREKTGPGGGDAGQAHGTRPGWRGWPPGGSGWADPGTYRDLEQLARRFTRELRTAAAQAHAVSEDAVGDLRTILDDALDRIKAEVFDVPDTSHPAASPPDPPHPAASRPDASQADDPRRGDGHPGAPR